MVVSWDEVCVDCVGPWTIRTSNGIVFEFNALTCINPVTILVESIQLEGSNPGADYCGGIR